MRLEVRHAGRVAEAPERRRPHDHDAARRGTPTPARPPRTPARFLTYRPLQNLRSQKPLAANRTPARAFIGAQGKLHPRCTMRDRQEGLRHAHVRTSCALWGAIWARMTIKNWYLSISAASHPDEAKHSAHSIRSAVRGRPVPYRPAPLASAVRVSVPAEADGAPGTDSGVEHWSAQASFVQVASGPAFTVICNSMNGTGASFKRLTSRGFVSAPRTVTQRYAPPANVRMHAIADLLAGSPRQHLAAAQMSLITAWTPNKEASIYASGDLGLLQHRCISVIGTRKVTEAGAARARRLARELSTEGIVVVSGLAEGVDTAAMSSAIESSGRTIGVIGTPLDQAYPAKNARLQELVYREHLLLSQFSPGERVFKSNFPQRNRLMALLSDATVVIEASDTSGTLHQAAECIRLGRWLFIAKSVVDDPALTWPAKFTREARCRILTSTADLIQIVYAPCR
jgi:DNA processing protein